MNKNILAEYQKRVEEMLATLGKYQAIIDEGIEESQNRTDTRLAELQARREELEQPIDMSDVSDTVIDRRATVERSYSDDREGYLLSEYDKRRLDGYEGPEFAGIVEEIKTVREAKRLEQKELVEEEMQDLIEEQLDIDNARFAEAEKTSLIMQLQEEKDKIEANIERKKDNIDRKISELDDAYAEGITHKQALSLYKNPSSKVYTAAKTELEKCTRKAELAQTRVKRLTREIAHLEQDLGQIDGLLDKLSNSREVDEISRQEDEMWEEYITEQEATRARRDKEVTEGLDAKRVEEEQEEAKIAEETKKEIEGYADGLNPEEPAEPNPVQPMAGRKSQGPAKPQQPTGPKPGTPPKPDAKQEKWKVESVAFTIEGGSNPVYVAIVSNGKEKKEVTSNEIAVLDEEFDCNEIKRLKEGKGIYEAESCYDKGLATLLEKIDGEFGTRSLNEYQELLKDREMIHRYPERYEDSMKINYDFSALKGKATADMKKLQKIAKECGAKGVAIYQKRPNIFQKIWRSLTGQVRLLKEIPLEPNESIEELRTASMIGKMKEELEDRPYELDIDALKDYPEFSPEVAHEQLEGSEKSIEELANLDETIDAAKEWRKAQQIETPTVDPEDLPKGKKSDAEKEL